MTVRSVTVHQLRCEMPGALRNARRRWTHKDILLVFVEDDKGRLGVGEGWTSYASPRALAATIEDDIAPLALGRSPVEARDLVETARQSCVMSGRYGITAVAASAVEIALWDLAAKVENLPLYRLLGTGKADIPVYASGGLYRAEDAQETLGQEMLRYAQAGFTSLKIKIGGAALDEDIRRLAEVRAAVGDDVDLLVDAHYTMDVESALAFAEAAAPYRIGWLEAPILPTDWEGYRHLAEHSPIPICGNETLPWRDGFEQLAKAGVTFIMPDVSACGGIAETLAIARLARDHDRQITLHSSSSIVLFAASLHVAAACPNLHSVENHMMHRWLFEHGSDAMRVPVKGRIQLGDATGLGIDITPDDLEDGMPALHING